MPGGELKILGLSLCLPIKMDRYRSGLEQSEGRWDIIELDNLLRGLLECSPHCDS